MFYTKREETQHNKVTFKFVNKVSGKKIQLIKGLECLLTALPIAQAQRTLIDHLSVITPLVPMACSKGQQL